MTLCDTGPLVAIIDCRDVHHTSCLSALASIPEGDLVRTWPCLTEAMYFLSRAGGAIAQETLWSYIADGALNLYTPEPDEWQRIRTLMRRYHDGPMDLADASLVSAAEKMGVGRVLPWIATSRAYRIQGRNAFDVIP